MGKLFVISGASGVGKGTVLGKITAKRDDLLFSLSATTRAPRPEDINGVTYDFITREKFMEMVAQDAFAEYDIHLSACYGTPRAQMEEKLSRGHVLLDIEPKGAFQVREGYPGVTLIFIEPPDMKELERRLRTRPDTTLSEEKIMERLERANWEMAQKGQYDYVVVNDDADRCAEEILKIISDKEHEE
jgi:guanylate kinase